MQTLRVPFAAVSGVLVSLAVFLGLWQLVNVPFEAGDPVPIFSVDFTPQRADTPPETKRNPKPKREQPIVVPESTLIVDDFGVDPTMIRPTGPVAVAPPRTKGLSIGADRDTTPLVRIEPDYPATAISRGIEGWVQLRFNVTETGSVSNVVVVESEPGTVFDAAAVKAVQRWRYNPRIESGLAVERAGLQTVLRFELEN